jgi:hypothetical protein
MNCANHSETAAIAVCSACQKPLCDTCVIHWRNAVVCKHCLEKDNLLDREKEGMRKSPTLAGFLSLMPGLGQAYLGYYKSGFIMVLIVAATITFLDRSNGGGLEPLFGMFLSFFWIFNIIDAVRKAKLYNRHMAGAETIEAPTDSPLAGGIILLIVGLLLTLSITLNVDLEFLENLWPLALLAGGIYLLWKYVRTRNEMMARRDASALPPGGHAPDRSSRDPFGS